ncbi:MAG: hypothetical protein ABIN01_15540 [Ferruginibacter sp.]
MRTYEGISNASCSPITYTSFTSSPDVGTKMDTCNVTNVTYNWAITNGSNTASIIGSSSESTVAISIKGEGVYTLRLANTVTCGGVSTCSNATYYTDTVYAEIVNKPTLKYPYNKQVITQVSKRGLTFDWQPSALTSPGTKYVLKITEIKAGKIKAGNGFDLIGTPLFENIVSSSSFLYTPGLPRLLPGKTYAWQVTAIGSKAEKKTLKNAAKSDVNVFTIASAATMGYYCNCSVSSVTIQRTNQSPNFFSYQGDVQGTCTGDYYCQGISRIEYLWSIVGGGAFIDGPADGATVNVTTAGPATFTIALKGTIVCSDGTTCDSTQTFRDSFAYQPKNCSCDIDVDCKRNPPQGNLRVYQGILKGGCTGEYGPTAPYTPCAIKNVTWLWQVSEGNAVAEIVGADNQQTVNVRIKGNGAYTMRVQADVECSDGTKSCGSFNFDYCFDTARIEKQCNFKYTESNLPMMAGGLSDVIKKKEKVRRDEFIYLIGSGRDYDKVTIECTPSYECDSSQKKSSQDVLLAGKVKYEWEIQSGEGSFVKLGSLPDNGTTADGERVIFKPPYVAWPDNNQSNTKTTVIFLRISDENGTGALLDENVYDRITITTKRSRNQDPDHYDIEIQSIPWKPIKLDLKEDNNGVCKARYSWDKDNDLKEPTIKLPAVPDNDKMVLGQWMILEANNQNETDELKMVCESTDCTDDGGKKEYYDNIIWEWFLDKDDGSLGKFVGGNTGRFVIYAAPDSMPNRQTNELTINVVVSVSNENVQELDQYKISKPITFKVFKPGVKLEYPPLNWLPTEGNSVSLKSSLAYFQNNTWQPALAHMARIHFFELLDVSTEKGIAMNSPVPNDADQCRDLLLKQEGHTEVFNRNNPQMPNCKTDGYFVHARTQKPLKETTVTVNSEDYGSYGFLRSFANINQGQRDSIKGELPVYVAVPVAAAAIAHPAGRPKKNNYLDNRVTVPRDVDENRIPDDGWRSLAGAKINDPANPQNDDDSQIAGDGYAGDGLSNYEEYRGFFVKGSHLRTHINNKDLFIYNPDNFNLIVLESALTNAGGGIRVHQIELEEYVNNIRREINFNYNPQLHMLPTGGEPIRVQKGLFLTKRNAFREGTNGKHFSTSPLEEPAPPNWTERVEIYEDNVASFATRLGVNFAEKLNQVCAHELSHALNVWHHGRPGPGGNQSTMNGLRSGNLSCYMRYDNRLPRVAGYATEDIGNILCNSPTGTGYNANIPCVVPNCFGDAAAPRGNCIGQPRISCRTITFPRRN